MGTISTRDKRILRHRLEEAQDFIEAAIEEVDAIKDEPCEYCKLQNGEHKDIVDKNTYGEMAMSRFDNAFYLVAEFARDEYEGETETETIYIKINYCLMCGRDLKGEGK